MSHKIARQFYDSRLDHWLNDWREGAAGNGPCRDDLLGENQHGDLYVPALDRDAWWDRPFNPRNPRHWPYWLRSRRLRNIAMIETSVSDV